MSKPNGRFMLEAFRQAVKQIREEFDEHRTSGGERKFFLHLLSRFNTDRYSIFVLSFLHEMATHPTPFHEQVAAWRLNAVVPTSEVLDAVRVLSDFGLIVLQDDPTGSNALYYKVNDEFRDKLGTRTHTSTFAASYDEEAAEGALLRQALRRTYAEVQPSPQLLQRLYEVQRQLTWSARLRARWTKAFGRGTDDRSVTQVEILGASIDQTTDSFNEILNLLGPPPESSDDQLITPPTVPAGVS